MDVAIRSVIQHGGSLLEALADLVLARRCAGCATVPGLLCRGCSRMLTRRPVAVTPIPRPAQMPPTFAAAVYAGPVREALLAHKEEGRLGLARPLGQALAVAAAAALSAAPFPARRGGLAGSPLGADGRGGQLVGSPLRVVLVPVPSAPAAVRRRGHDPVLRMARVAATELRRHGVAARCLPVLRHQRRIADQAGLTATERRANLAAAFAVAELRAPAVAGRSVVVVDDLVTTGASLREAARALWRAGAQVVGAAVVAATKRRG